MFKEQWQWQFRSLSPLLVLCMGGGDLFCRLLISLCFLEFVVCMCISSCHDTLHRYICNMPIIKYM